MCIEICDASTKKEKAEFVNLIYLVYSNISEYRDNLCFTCKNFIYRKDAFARKCWIRPVLVRENGVPIARCAYIVHPGLDAVQIALFEALPGKREAVDIILATAKELASENSLDTILVGINGHTSYGVGFLCNRFSQSNPFDGIYTPEYYPDYFRQRGFKEHSISTYYVKTSNFSVGNKILDRVYKRFTFRKADLRSLRSEMGILGELFNESLKNTPFYFARPIGEWYELFKDLAPLLKNENILYAMENGREIGFLFWHPDYNMVLNDNRKNGVVDFYLKYILHRRRITQFKINAIGILPAYANSGAIIGLFNELYTQVNGKYTSGETGFVFDDNTSSARVCQRFCGEPYRHYTVFETMRQDL